MLEQIGEFIGNLLQRTLLLIVVGAVGLFLLFFFTREGSGADPDAVRATQAAISLESDVAISTRAAQLTLTPSEGQLTAAAPTVALLGREEIRQFAAAAESNVPGFDTIEFAAVQAAGPPNVEGCTSSPQAWASQSVQAQLTVSFAQLVRPTGVIVYQNFNPGFVEQIVITDVLGERRIVYQATPGDVGLCPFTLVVPIQNASYAANRVTIFLNQSTSTGGFSQIDAVELVGIRY